MALVAYSDSDEADSPSQSPARKRKQRDHDEADSASVRLPAQNHRTSLVSSPTTASSTSVASSLPCLPSTFHSLYASNVRSSTNDDPTLHSGRTRQIPHVEGNWPTHIYLEWYPSLTELYTLRTLILSISESGNSPNPIKPGATLHSLLESDLGAQLPLHISLSAPISLDTPQKASFLDDLERAITTTTAAIAGFKALTTRTGALEWVANFDRTRWFLVLRVASLPGDAPVEDRLGRLLRACNRVVKGFGQPALYDQDAEARSIDQGRVETRSRNKRKEVAPIREDAAAASVHGPGRPHGFHISIAWTLDDPDRGSGLGELPDVTMEGMEIRFSGVKVRIGNVVHDIPLG